MKNSPITPELDFNAARWPPAEEFPLNEQGKHQKVRDILRPDIFAASDDFLIITGYTSLSEIISTFGTGEYNGKAQIHIVFGVEPQASGRTKWKRSPLHEDVESYWWKQGISPFKCGMVLGLIEHIRAQRVCFRIKDNLHAKIYASKNAAMMGSSNFSHNGLTQLHEANIRVRADGGGSQPYQHAALRKIAENFWEESIPFDDKIIGLLERLMQVVDWEEALARAIAAVLEGHFLDSYQTLRNRLNELKLWPSQMLGIYQGLNILQNQGSILIADPTGSGKTKMICAIQLALVHWLWEIGQQDRSSSLSITPPAVISAWDKAQSASGKILRRPISHGILSRKDTPNYAQTIQLLKQANILVVDEAHNYLSSTSDRSQAMAEHEATFSLLATATPINKKAEDLLRLIELLDADNLSDAELETYKNLYEHHVSAEENEDSEGTLQALRSYIWQFTLRRTKKEINELIAKDRDSYRNDLGNRCQYPNVKAEEYPMNETDADVEAAKNILDAASNLKGLIFLKTLKPPVWKTLDTEEAKQAYVQGRLRAAKALAQYRVQAMMRSSRAALYEHILGTTAANNRYKLQTPKNTETGNIVRTLRLRSAPEESTPCETSFVSEVLPDWLSDWEQFKVACKEEIATYNLIIRHLEDISDGRERTKAAYLLACLKKHDLVVAFDHTIITLHQLAEFLKQQGADYRLATGEQSKGALEALLDEFGLHSKQKGIIALCSDAMSEGVNMQKASAVVMLDMPSILRLAEQRIGRIDRLDSPHKTITVHWPIDHEVFALRADANLFRTTHLTRRLLGSNLTLPEEFNKRFEELKAMTTAEIVTAVEQARKDDEQTWEGVQDAFSEIRALKEGDRAIIRESLYKDLSKTKASVRCRLSFVVAQSSWAFIATTGTERRPPRWIFIDESEAVQTQFSDIARLLRSRLQGVEKAAFSQADLDRFLTLYKDNERRLLPHKKRRAIQAAEHLLGRQLAFEERRKNAEGAALVKELLNLFHHGLQIDDAIIDYHLFAQQWLQLLLPKLREKRAQLRFRCKRKYADLDDFLKTRTLESHFTTAELLYIRDNVPLTEPLDHQIAACIIGVRRGNDESPKAATTLPAQL